MESKQILEETLTWTKQALQALDQVKVDYDQKIDSIGVKAAGYLFYGNLIGETLQSELPAAVKAALVAGEAATFLPFKEIVLNEVQTALDAATQYKIEESFGSGISGWAKTAGLAGLVSLMVNSTDTAVSNPEVSFTRNQERVEYALPKTNSQKISNLSVIIEEPNPEKILNLKELEENYFLPKIPGTAIEKPEITFSREDLEEMHDQLEYMLEVQDLLDKELHPRSEEYYKRITGRKLPRLTKKFERTRQYDNYIKAAAEKYDIDDKLLTALIIKESDGKRKARSPAGAVGLMQLMPDTAKEIGKKCVYRTNAKRNIDCGAKYLRQMYDRTNIVFARHIEEGKLSDDEVWDIAMACYNRGFRGFTTDLVKAKEISYWDLQKKETTGEAYFYSARIRAIQKALIEYQMKEEGKVVAKGNGLVH